MTNCDKIQTIGTALQDNLNDRGVSCIFGNTSGKQTLLDMANLINSNNLLGSGDSVITISASRPYLLSGEKTDLIVKLHNGVGAPLMNKEVTISDGTNSYTGITDSNGMYTLYNISVTQDTTFTATYNTVSDSCLVEYCLFVDYCTTQNNQSTGYQVGSNKGTYSLDDTCLTLTSTNSELNFREYNNQITIPFKICFSLIQVDMTSRVYFYNGNFGTSLTNATVYTFSSKETPVEFTVTGTGVTRKIGSTESALTGTPTGSTASFRFSSLESGSIKYRNFRIKPVSQ